MEKSSSGTRAPNKTQLWDVQIALSARLNQTVHRGLQRGIAEAKKKALIAQGVLKRNIWIIPHASEQKTIKRYS